MPMGDVVREGWRTVKGSFTFWKHGPAASSFNGHKLFFMRLILVVINSHCDVEERELGVMLKLHPFLVDSSSGMSLYFSEPSPHCKNPDSTM